MFYQYYMREIQLRRNIVEHPTAWFMFIHLNVNTKTSLHAECMPCTGLRPNGSCTRGIHSAEEKIKEHTEKCKMTIAVSVLNHATRKKDKVTLKQWQLGWVQKLGKNEVREGSHDPSGQKEGHVKALKQQTACHIPCKGLGYKVGGSTKDDLTGTGRRDQGFYRLVRGFCLHPKSKRKPLEV